MKISVNSSFLRYDLSPEELKTAFHFSLESRALIQNIIADSAEEKIALTVDCNNPLQNLQAEAELQGKIGILKYLLSLEAQNQPEVN